MSEHQHTFQSKTRLGLYMGPELNSDYLYKGVSLVVDAESLAEVCGANDVFLIRIKSKVIVQVKWPDPFFPLGLQNEFWNQKVAENEFILPGTRATSG